MPVLLLSGEDDPVGGYGQMVIKAYEVMKDAGLVDINYKLYQKMRHEILNEKEQNIVYEAIHQWLEAAI